jgi:hypothetical protein
VVEDPGRSSAEVTVLSGSHFIWPGGGKDGHKVANELMLVLSLEN